MTAERNIDIAMSTGLLVQEEVDRARLYVEEEGKTGRKLSLWESVRELGFINDKDADRIEQRHSTAEIGTPTIDGYELVDKLGSGGMGEVFLGVHSNGDEVAVKLLPTRLARDAEYLGRFQREIQAMQALEHPYIVRYVGNGTHHGRPYLTMELVRGVSLKDHILSQGALGEEEVRVLLRQMSDALQAAWDAGLVHRDVKPANIVLGPPLPNSNDPFCAKLCDFGLAKFHQNEHNGEPLTHTGIAIGTPHYMSPEQATGDRSADPRHDVYGLAATVYHALQGKTLYSGRSSAVIMYKHATARLDMRPLRERRIGEEFIELLEAMLAKPKEVRLPNFDAVIERMEALPQVVEGRTRKPIVITERRHLTDKHKKLLESRRVTKDKAAKSPNRLSKRFQRATSPIGLLLAVGAVVLLVAGLFLTLTEGKGSHATVQAGPATLARIIADASNGHQQLVIELESGVYQGPWRFGANRPFVLQATNGMAVLASPDGASVKQSLIDVAGAGDVTIRGVAIRDAVGPVLRVGAGARCEVISSDVQGAASIGVNEGELALSGCTIRGVTDGLSSKPGSSVVITDSVLTASGTVLGTNESLVTLRRSRIRGDGNDGSVVLSIVGGSVVCDRVVIEGNGRVTGMYVESCALAEFENVSITNVMTGIDLSKMRAGVAKHITIEADRVGVRWDGSHNSWTWAEVSIDAADPVIGFEGMVVDGSGANSTALRSISGG